MKRIDRKRKIDERINPVFVLVGQRRDGRIVVLKEPNHDDGGAPWEIGLLASADKFSQADMLKKLAVAQKSFPNTKWAITPLSIAERMWVFQ